MASGGNRGIGGARVGAPVRRQWTPAHGRHLRSLRGSKELTRAQLVGRFSVSGDESTIKRLENGSTKYPRMSTLKAVAKALSVEVEDLWRTPPPDLPPINERGVILIQALPHARRYTDLYLRILGKLDDAGVTCVFIDGFNMGIFWKEIGESLQAAPNSRSNSLREWARESHGRRALVLSGFRPSASETDPQDVEEEWVELCRTLKTVDGSCTIVLIQAVNPFHGPAYTRGSTIAPKPWDLPLGSDDLDALCDPLLRELPSCCARTVSEILHRDRLPEPDTCSVYLLAAGVLRRTGDRLRLAQKTWEEPWRANLARP